jgi:hypothetical protein
MILDGQLLDVAGELGSAAQNSLEIRQGFSDGDAIGSDAHLPHGDFVRTAALSRQHAADRYASIDRATARV